MKIRITVYSVFFTLYSLVFLVPSYFSNGITTLLSNVVFFFGICFLLLMKYRPSKFITAAALYMALIIAMSFINKTDLADYHLVVSHMKMVTYLAVTEWLLKKDTSRTINILFGVFLIYVLMDWASIVLFPNGLYFKETVWNEWSTSQYAQWLFGNKNNHSHWYLCLLILACWKNHKRKYPFADTKLTILLVASFAAVLMLNSATSSMVILTAAIGIWLGVLSKKDTVLRISAKLILPVFLLAELILITGNVFFLQPIIEGLLGRSMSFTNRTIIWARALFFILQKPFFGWGLFGEKATTMLGSLAFVNVHNQLLDVLWQGGIFGLVLFCILILLITQKIELVSNNRKNLLLVFLFGAILVEMLAETILGVDKVWVYLLLCYWFPEYIAAGEAKQTMEERQ